MANVVVEFNRRNPRPRQNDGETDPPARPTIRVEAGEIERMTQEAIEALPRDDNLYQRGGELVALTREPERLEPYDGRDTRKRSNVLIRPGTPRIRSLTTASLRVRMATVAAWEKWRRPVNVNDGGEYVPADPPDKVVSAVLDVGSDGGWPRVRPIRGIIEAPTVAPSGRIISKAGYDDETGYVLIPSIEVPPIRSNPQQVHARAALRYLWTEIFGDFPYLSLGESDPRDGDRIKRFERAVGVPDAFVGIAALLSLFARPAVAGSTPGFVFEAASQGSGKTLQIHAVSTIATGRAAGLMTFPIRDGRADESELEKVLASYALAGSRAVAFDNVKGTLGGPALEKAMTAVDSIDLRVLGSNDLRTLPWVATIMVSGNNMAMSDDVAQRVLVSRLESAREDPRSRDTAEYKHPRLLDWIKPNRSQLIRACLTILKAGMTGQRMNGGSWGSFEAWSEIIPQCIMFAGGPNVLDARPKGESVDTGDGGAHATLMRCWPDDAKEGIRAASLIRRAFAEEREIHAGKAADDGQEDLRESLRELTETADNHVPSALKLGHAFRRLRGKWRDNRKLVDRKDGKGFTVWNVVAREVQTIAATDQTALPMILPQDLVLEPDARPDPGEDWDRE
jgi:putative DNA primase/helicase